MQGVRHAERRRRALAAPDGAVTAFEYIVSAGQFVALATLAVTVIFHLWKEKRERHRAEKQATAARKLAADKAESERKLAAQLETLHYIISSNRSEVLTDGRRAFAAKQREGDEALKKIAEDDANPVNGQIALYLNQFEIAAIGIRHGAFDEELYKDWFKDAYIRAFDRAWPYIDGRRKHKNDNRLYEHFEGLAKAWSEKDRPEPIERTGIVGEAG